MDETKYHRRKGKEGRRGRTGLEKRWAKRAGKKLGDLYQARKRRNYFSLATLGEALGFGKESQTSSVNCLINGEARLKPEYIQKLARKLSEYTSKNPDHPKTEKEIEAYLAVHAGQQMPSFLTLEEYLREQVLNLIARTSLFGLVTIRHKNSLYIPAAAPWRIALKEVMQALEGWLAVFDFEEALESQDIFEPSGIGRAGDRWNKLVEVLDSSQMPLQTAYAHTLWARILTRVGASRVAEGHARRAEDVLAQYARRSRSASGLEEVLPLKYQAFVALGDNARAQANFEDALQHYGTARDAVDGLSDENKDKIYLRCRIDTKEFNTHLLARVCPPSKLLKRVQELTDSTSDPSLKSRAFNALAWLERSRRGEESVKSVEYGLRAVALAEESEDVHYQAVSHQYFGETLLHLGDLDRSLKHLKIALKRHRPLNYGRLGFTNLLCGRGNAYLALRAYLENEGGWKRGIAAAMDYFEESDNRFLFHLSRAAGSSYQRTQLLIERAKWEAIRAWMELNPGPGTERPELVMRFKDNLRKAEGRLNEAKGLQTSRHDRFSIAVNELIIKYINWVALKRNDKRLCAQLNRRVEEEIESLINPLSLPTGFDPMQVTTFEHELDGHRARLFAISGALRWELDLSRSQSFEIALEKSVWHASQYDFLSLVDSLWLAHLVIDSVQLESTFYNWLGLDIKKRLRSFLATGSSGWSSLS